MTVLRAISIAALALILNVAVSTQASHAAPTSKFTGFSWPAYTAPGVHYTSPVKTATVTPNLSTGFNDLWTIYAYDAYCAGGGAACVANCSMTTPGGFGCNPSLAAVFALGSTPDALAGNPGFTFAGCAVPQPGGGYLAGFALVATPDFITMETGLLPPFNELVPAAIGGKGTLLSAQQGYDTYDPYENPPGSETLTSSTSSLSYSAYSYITGTVATVTGVQNTDNTMDQENGGQFRITLTGYLFNTSTYNVQRGTLSCMAGGPNSMDVANFMATNSPYPPQVFAGAQGEMEEFPYFNVFSNFIYPNT